MNVEILNKVNILCHTMTVYQCFLFSSADPDFERYRPNSIVALYYDGTVIWFTPAIYTVICRVRVKWFPFDVQKCEMVFGSWGYNGYEIDVYPEDSVDATTDR